MILAVILFILAVLFIFIGVVASKKNKIDIQKFKESGVDFESKIEAGKYAGGHPLINEPFDSCQLFFKNGDILITTNKNIVFVEKGIIEGSMIKTINILDSSTIEKNITLGRVLLVGVFALAWKKNNKKEMYFLEIQWNDNRFDHSTLFCFEGYEVLKRANTARNALINGLKN